MFGKKNRFVYIMTMLSEILLNLKKLFSFTKNYQKFLK